MNKTLLTIATGLMAYSSGNAGQTHQQPPNILVFIADDASMDYGCYGNTGIKTPNIDKLAAEGLLFNKAFLTSSQCSPSRTSLLSGQFAHTIGTENLHTFPESPVNMLPHYLSEQGYYTGIMLKTHIGEHAMNQFDWYDNGMADWRQGTWGSKVGRNFQDFLNLSEGKPFFMWVGFIDPHRPYGDSITGAPEVHDPETVTVPPYLVDSRKTREDLARYYDAIHRMDTNIGEILQELENKGLSENTLIIFFSDNGYPFPRGKATVYDAGIQTPLIMKWSRHIEPRTSYDQLVSLIDLAPTILDVAGAKIPEEMYGRSIASVFNNQNIPGRDYIFAERNWHDSYAYIRCVRSVKYKLIINECASLPFPITGDYWKSGSWAELLRGQMNNTLNASQSRIFEFPRPSVEFYDLENDPFELVNLSNYPDYFHIMESMNNELLRWQVETGDSLPPDNPLLDIVDRKSGFLYNRIRNRTLEKKQ